MNRLLPLMLLGSLATGCASYVPFTNEVRTQHSLANADVRHLQFYLSDDVTLRREVQHHGREITDGGKLELVSGKEVEEIVIGAHTPGIAIAVDNRSITVSFEQGSALRFSLLGQDPVDAPLRVLPDHSGFAKPPQPFPGDAAHPDDGLADRVGDYFLAGGEDEVAFRGKRWRAVGDSHKAHLMIDAESLDHVDQHSTTLSGRRL